MSDILELLGGCNSCDRLKAKIQDLERKLESKKKVVDTVRQVFNQKGINGIIPKTFHEQLSSLRKKLHDSNTQIVRYNETIDDLRRKNKELDTLVFNYETNSCNLELRIKTLNEDHAELLEQVKKYKRELATYRRKESINKKKKRTRNNSLEFSDVEKSDTETVDCPSVIVERIPTLSPQDSPLRDESEESEALGEENDFAEASAEVRRKCHEAPKSTDVVDEGLPPPEMILTDHDYSQCRSCSGNQEEAGMLDIPAEAISSQLMDGVPEEIVDFECTESVCDETDVGVNCGTEEEVVVDGVNIKFPSSLFELLDARDQKELEQSPVKLIEMDETDEISKDVCDADRINGAAQSERAPSNECMADQESNEIQEASKDKIEDIASPAEIFEEGKTDDSYVVERDCPALISPIKGRYFEKKCAAVDSSVQTKTLTSSVEVQSVPMTSNSTSQTDTHYEEFGCQVDSIFPQTRNPADFLNQSSQTVNLILKNAQVQVDEIIEKEVDLPLDVKIEGTFKSCSFHKEFRNAWCLSSLSTAHHIFSGKNLFADPPKYHGEKVSRKRPLLLPACLKISGAEKTISSGEESLDEGTLCSGLNQLKLSELASEFSSCRDRSNEESQFGKLKFSREVQGVPPVKKLKIFGSATHSAEFSDFASEERVISGVTFPGYRSPSIKAPGKTASFEVNSSDSLDRKVCDSKDSHSSLVDVHLEDATEIQNAHSSLLENRLDVSEIQEIDSNQSEIPAKELASFAFNSTSLNHSGYNQVPLVSSNSIPRIKFVPASENNASVKQSLEEPALSSSIDGQPTIKRRKSPIEDSKKVLEEPAIRTSKEAVFKVPKTYSKINQKKKKPSKSDSAVTGNCQNARSSPRDDEERAFHEALSFLREEVAFLNINLLSPLPASPEREHDGNGHLRTLSGVSSGSVSSELNWARLTEREVVSDKNGGISPNLGSKENEKVEKELWKSSVYDVITKKVVTSPEKSTCKTNLYVNSQKVVESPENRACKINDVVIPKMVKSPEIPVCGKNVDVISEKAEELAKNSVFDVISEKVVDSLEKPVGEKNVDFSSKRVMESPENPGCDKSDVNSEKSIETDNSMEKDSSSSKIVRCNRDSLANIELNHLARFFNRKNPPSPELNLRRAEDPQAHSSAAGGTVSRCQSESESSDDSDSGSQLVVDISDKEDDVSEEEDASAEWKQICLDDIKPCGFYVDSEAIPKKDDESTNIPKDEPLLVTNVESDEDLTVQSELIPCESDALTVSLKYWYEQVAEGSLKANRPSDEDFKRIDKELNLYCKVSSPVTPIASVYNLQTCDFKLVSGAIIKRILKMKMEKKTFTPIHHRLISLVAALIECAPKFLHIFLDAVTNVAASYAEKEMTVEDCVKLSTFYCQLCQIFGLKGRMVSFIVDIIYARRLKARPVVFNLLKLWPNLLPHYSMSRGDLLTMAVVIALCQTKPGDTSPVQGSIIKCFKYKYGYRHIDKVDHTQFVEDLLSNLTVGKNEIAAVLYCKARGWMFTVDIMNAWVIPRLTSWESGERSLSDLDVAKLVTLLGRLSRNVPPSVAVATFNKSFALLEKILARASNSVVTDATVEAICHFRKHNAALCGSILSQWIPPSRMISKRALSCIWALLKSQAPDFWINLYRIRPSVSK